MSTLIPEIIEEMLEESFGRDEEEASAIIECNKRQKRLDTVAQGDLGSVD